MDGLLESIRTGIASDASPQARDAAAAACRTIFTALEAKPGQPLAVSPINASQIASVVGALRGVPPDQLLDLAIAKLRAALPTDAQVSKIESLKFHLIHLPVPGAKP